MQEATDLQYRNQSQYSLTRGIHLSSSTLYRVVKRPLNLLYNLQVQVMAILVKLYFVLLAVISNLLLVSSLSLPLVDPGKSSRQIVRLR